MGVSITQILAPQTAGVATPWFTVMHGPVVLRLSGDNALLQGAETVTLYYKDADGSPRAVHDVVTGLAQMTAGQNCMVIQAVGEYRALITATADDTGLEIVA